MIPETLQCSPVSEIWSYQIAHEADVSPSTLSRIINGIDLALNQAILVLSESRRSWEDKDLFLWIRLER